MASQNPRERDQVDGIYQGDQVRNTSTGQRGEVTFADPAEHESHVRLDDGEVEIWPHADVERIT
ncbi:hypothetical protein AB0F17_59635 [Nonomuraea sp. NPDC026600]|uniref:hypothetical protein n=1 Tax=Nonomuraea sp. NPDC026600 TaxID=3155363 RepID=UPI0033C3DB75